MLALPLFVARLFKTRPLQILPLVAVVFSVLKAACL